MTTKRETTKRAAAVLVAAALMLLAWAGGADASSVNLIQGGDFSSPGAWTSGYERRDGGQQGWNPGTYTVGGSGCEWHPLFVCAGDHTSGAGEMFLGNGSLGSGAAVWSQEFDGLDPGREYAFSAWTMNLCCTSGAQRPGSLLDFRWDGVSFGGGQAGDPGLWVQVQAVLSGVTGGTLSIFNLSSLYDGNDFALDDLDFVARDPAVPEPATGLLLLGGLAAAARARWRRRGIER